MTTLLRIFFPTTQAALEQTMTRTESKPAASAIAAHRWRFDFEGQSRGRWWYTVLVEGAHGARYEVELIHPDGMRPMPFKVRRSGRTTRGIGRSNPDLRRAIEEVAMGAIQ